MASNNEEKIDRIKAVHLEYFIKQLKEDLDIYNSSIGNKIKDGYAAKLVKDFDQFEKYVNEIGNPIVKKQLEDNLKIEIEKGKKVSLKNFVEDIRKNI